jgi:F-type H+-transporting ATPase subunit alpha
MSSRCTLTEELEDHLDRVDELLSQRDAGLVFREVGKVTRVSQGVATVEGLASTGSEEVLEFPGRRLGWAFNLDPDEIGVVLMDHVEGIEAGDEVRRTGRVLDTPVGEALLGRVVDPAGRPLDGKGEVRAAQRLPIERPAPRIRERAAVRVPMQTGIKVVDALFPIGRGQRELIVGDRQTGKTALALDAILNQGDQDVVCVYCAIGQSASAIARLVADLVARGAMEHTIVVVTAGEDPAGMQFVAPYAATSMAEYFMEQGRDVLVVYDDLTRHARAYRELSLLLRRPPGREAFPGDVFYIHSRLLERSTQLSEARGGGSLTALPIVETEAGNISGFVPTNLISITDGQLYLSTNLLQKGLLPAVDVGRSVSRVGGKAQLPALRAVAGGLRLAYAQFQELELFTRYGARLEPERRRTLEHGRRVRAVLRQWQYAPMPVEEQVCVLLAVESGLLDEVPLERVSEVELRIREAARAGAEATLRRIRGGARLDVPEREELLDLLRREVSHGDA